MPKKIYENNAEKQKAYRMRIRVNQDWEQLRRDVDALSSAFDLIEALDRRVAKLEELAERRR